VATRLKLAQARSQVRRRKIVAAATRLFGRRGIAQTSLTDVARLAGVPLPSLYDYFKDKRALYEAIVKREISLACPGYEAVLASALEEAIDRVGLKGTVQTLIKIRGNQVVEVTPTSGPKEYHKYVQAAVKRMRCTAGGADEVQVSLPVIFS